ncbi:hypothetical protein EZS27_018767 [termite gut metagenome]|uniref:DUF4435 domain-containing protein n=1 Tax=termite gut metagenome TaxID=433724 RepID=A0A5J4RGI3_9ZZZZ
MLDIKRNIDELIAIYSIESELLDIYVEGPTDKFIIENYLEYKNISKSIIEINDVDLFLFQEKYADLDFHSNKDKLIAFSRILNENSIQSNIKCVVDRDFDGILFELENNQFLVYTDFSCIESYLMCKNHIDKILKFGIKNFPHESKYVLTEISSVLCELFIIRMINKHFKFNFSLPQKESHIIIDKKTGKCTFNFDNYLELFININKIRNRKKEILEFIEIITPRIPNDIRFQMNGHDFIEILFSYINKIKNTVNFRRDNFERTFYLSIQPNHLEEYNLFKILSE